ncbi:zinc finger domain-containing protein [Mycolicibacterium arseniciresistens]|uniref:DNA-binding phage zinc finger domain-containing protein n=1 Tax=Mycolicibacterium arseniciresistens TaxID=3062257 RepID=A0ABT8UGM0_9MYCO|nr:hypothetical protein [Mycolicibacterium arseniciresistens]MDO3636010.1 hypothetical protein [Mycolicibacterium arseniciresistens]
MTQRRLRIFDDVYADAAMERQCPNCGAEPNDYCRRPDGEIRSVPCILRVRLAEGSTP